MWSLWGNLLHGVMTGESARKRATGNDGFERFDTDPAAAAAFNRAMVELVRRVAVQAPVEVASSHPVRAVGSLPYTGG